MVFNVRLENVKKYLISKGWKIEKFNDKLDKISLTIDDESFEIVIPNSEKFADYEPRIDSLTESLSSIEDREKSQIISEIANIGYDLMKIKFQATGMIQGTIL